MPTHDESAVGGRKKGWQRRVQRLVNWLGSLWLRSLNGTSESTFDLSPVTKNWVVQISSVTTRKLVDHLWVLLTRVLNTIENSRKMITARRHGGRSGGGGGVSQQEKQTQNAKLSHCSCDNPLIITATISMVKMQVHLTKILLNGAQTSETSWEFVHCQVRSGPSELEKKKRWRR